MPARPPQRRVGDLQPQHGRAVRADVDLDAPAGEVAATRTRSPPAARSTSTWTSTVPVLPSTVTSGRTAASRAVVQRCSVTGRQMPAVTSSGTQSQPKLHAILRIPLKGWRLTCGRGPSSWLVCSVGVGLGGEVDGELVVARRRSDVTHVEAVAAVHVLRLAKEAPLRVDRGDGVQPAEVQVDPLAGRGRGGPEGRRVAPGGVPDPLEQPLVLVEVGVGDQAGGHQVGVHAAGHGRRHGRRSAASPGGTGPSSGRSVQPSCSAVFTGGSSVLVRWSRARSCRRGRGSCVWSRGVPVVSNLI